MRLIDADALMVTIRAHEYPLKSYFNSTDVGMFTLGIQQAVDEQPTVATASPWHRVEEPPKESGKQYAVWASKGYAYCDKWLGDRWLISSVAPETITHWMPIEPPKEDA